MEAGEGQQGDKEGSKTKKRSDENGSKVNDEKTDKKASKPKSDQKVSQFSRFHWLDFIAPSQFFHVQILVPSYSFIGSVGF